MTIQEMFKALRDLTPPDDEKLITVSATLYLSREEYEGVISCLELTTIAAIALGEKLNPLEGLAGLVLLKSANLPDVLQ